MIPRRGESSTERMKIPTPLRPLLLAIQAATSEKISHPMTISTSLSSRASGAQAAPRHLCSCEWILTGPRQCREGAAGICAAKTRGPHFRHVAELRQYRAAVEEAARRAGELSAAREEWIGWARAKADWIDPLIPTSDVILDALNGKRPGYW